ncbi:MAG: DUF2029 domain-containing protein [Dehalococcoidales bacterium]|nr:DUF2029 domain-containing protein [Dehalococcoidales bacterium]
MPKIISLLYRNRTLLLFGILNILIFTIFFKSGWIFGKFLQDDFALAYYYSSKTMMGQMPYLDFPVEYPPLAMVFMLIPRLFSSDPGIYADLFNVEMLVFDLIGLFLTASFARQFNKPLLMSLAVYSLTTICIGPLLIVRFDIIPAVLLLAALYLFISQHHSFAWVILALGTMTKLFPAIAIPLFLIYYFRHRQYPRALKGIVVFVVVCLVIALPPLLASPEGFVSSFTYHTGRSLQCETTYASFLLLAQAFGLGSLDIVNSSGSTNVISPLADALAGWSTVITAVLLLWVYWQYFRQQGKDKRDGVEQSGMLVNFTFLAVLLFILAGKVFSPQFIIWLFPLVPLLTTRWRNLPWLIFLMVGLMTAFVYPKDYGGLEYGELLAIGMLVLRNTALIVLAVLVAKGENQSYLR